MNIYLYSYRKIYTCMHACILWLHTVYAFLVTYSVQPHSIYYPNEPADVIYFSGSTIEFTCDVFCERSCESLLLYNKSFPLIHHNIFRVPLEYQLYNSGRPAKVTLKIINATASSAGSYQCLTEAWNNTYIVNKESRFRMAGMCTRNH